LWGDPARARPQAPRPHLPVRRTEGGLPRLPLAPLHQLRCDVGGGVMDADRPGDLRRARPDPPGGGAVRAAAAAALVLAAGTAVGVAIDRALTRLIARLIGDQP